MCLFRNRVRNRGFTSIYGTFLAKMMMMSPAGFWVCSAMIGETQVEIHPDLRFTMVYHHFI